MTFEQWMDHQYGKNWGVSMAALTSQMKAAFLAGRSSALREVEKDRAEEARAAASEARWQERQGEEYGSY